MTERATPPPTSPGCAGSTATAGSTAPTSPTTRWRCSGAGSTTRSRRGLHEPNAMVVATVSADGRPVVADGAAQGPRRARLRVLHQLRVAQGARRSTANPARLAAVPVARPAAPGPRRGHGVAGLARRRTRRTSPPGRASRSSVPGPRRSRAWWPRASALDERYGGVLAQFAELDDVPLPPFWGGLPGRAGGRWSSGRAARAGCTTGCVYRRAERPAARRGRWSGSPPDAGKPLVSERSLT